MKLIKIVINNRKTSTPIKCLEYLYTFVGDLNCCFFVSWSNIPRSDCSEALYSVFWLLLKRLRIRFKCKSHISLHQLILFNWFVRFQEISETRCISAHKVSVQEPSIIKITKNESWMWLIPTTEALLSSTLFVYVVCSWLIHIRCNTQNNTYWHFAAILR